MPHIRIHGVEREFVRENALQIAKAVKNVVGCPLEHIKILFENKEQVLFQENDKEYPMIDIYWVERPQAVMDDVAGALTKIFRKKYDMTQVTFTAFRPDSFYENGEHL